MEPNSNILILGIGNYLMGDEGIGVHMARQFEQEALCNADIVDGGTGGFHLLEYFDHYEHVVIVDATLDGNAPGTIRLIRPRFASDFPKAMSTHDIGLKDLVTALQLLNKMPELYLFVVSIGSIQQQGIELTPDVRNVLPLLRRNIIKLVNFLQKPAAVAS